MLKRKLVPASLLFLSTLIIALSSCKKDDIVLNNGPAGNNLKQLFTFLKSTPQTFMVTAGTNQVITGAKGTVLNFHPGSFKDGSGNVISSGMVTIELIEMYKPGEMIANRVTTATTSHRQLTSGGSVNIKATMNGAEVFTNGYDIAFRQPASSQNPMALFNGIPSVDSAGTSVLWSDDTTNTVLRTSKIDSVEGFYYMFDSCLAFNWINCDYFYSAPSPKTDVTVVMPDATYDRTNTMVYVIFPAINSVSMMYSYDAPTHSFKFGYSGYHIPVGSQITVVAISAKGSTYYLAEQQNITVANNHTLNLTPATQSMSYIQTFLNGL